MHCVLSWYMHSAGMCTIGTGMGEAVGVCTRDIGSMSENVGIRTYSRFVKEVKSPDVGFRGNYETRRLVITAQWAGASFLNSLTKH